MSLLSHLVTADAQRFKSVLAIWCAIVAAAALLHGVGPEFANSERLFDLISLVAIVTWIGGLLVMLGITAQVVQADPLVGTHAFWTTRPIPSLSLLAAKVVFVGIAMVVVPVVADVTLMQTHDVTLPTIGAVALQASIVQLFWISIAMSYATLTVGVAQFFLLCGATPFAIALGLLFLEMAVSSARMRAWLTPAAFEHPRAGFAFVLLTIVAAAGVLITMYRTRSRPRAVAVGFALLLMALVLPEFVSHGAASHADALPAWANAVGPLTADGVGVRHERNFNDVDVLRGRVRTSGLQPNWSVTIQVKDEAWLFLDGKGLKSDIALGFGDSLNGSSVWELGARESSTVATLKSVLGVEFVRGLPSDDTTAAQLFGTASAKLAALAGKAPSYRAMLTLSFVERAVAAVLPLERGASFNAGTRRVSIAAVHVPQHDDPSVGLTVRESIGRTVFQSQSPLVFEAYLRNAQRDEAVFGAVALGRHSGSSFSPSMLMPVPIVTVDRPFGFHIETDQYNFPPRFPPVSPSSVQIDESWLTGAELVIVAVREAGSIARVLEIPAVPVPARDETP